MDKNQVVLGDNKDLFTKTFLANDFNWIAFDAPQEPIRAKVKTRYKQKEQWATIRANSDGTVTVTFDEPQRAITVGQAAVLYDGDVVLGGGTIIKTQTNL